MASHERQPRTGSVRGFVVFGLAGFMLVVLIVGFVYRFVVHRWWPVEIAQTTISLEHCIDLVLDAGKYGTEAHREASLIAHGRLLDTGNLSASRKLVLRRLDRSQSPKDSLNLFYLGVHYQCPPGADAERLWGHAHRLLTIVTNTWERLQIIMVMGELASVVVEPLPGLCLAWSSIDGSQTHPEFDEVRTHLAEALLALPGWESTVFLIDQIVAVPSRKRLLWHHVTRRLLSEGISAAVEAIRSQWHVWPATVVESLFEVVSAQPGAYDSLVIFLRNQSTVPLAGIINGLCQSEDPALLRLLMRDWEQWALWLDQRDDSQPLQMVLRWIGYQEDLNSKDLIAPYLSHNDPAVRAQALQSWYMIFKEGGIAEVMHALEDEQVRQKAEHILLLMDATRVRPPYREVIVQLQADAVVPRRGSHKPISHSPSWPQLHDPYP